MKTQTTFPAKAQRRKARNTARPTSLVSARSRSLSTLRSVFAPLRLCGKLLVVFALLTLAAVATPAQEVADTIRIQTRVVFLDALVKDKRTGMPIADLRLDNFEVFDEGKPRPISYFTREGQARKPLALVLILDLRDDGAGRFLKRPEILKAMADELAKLPPEDEVAIVTINANQIDSEAIMERTGRALWLTRLTRDRPA